MITHTLVYPRVAPFVPRVAVDEIIPLGYFFPVASGRWRHRYINARFKT